MHKVMTKNISNHIKNNLLYENSKIKKYIKEKIFWISLKNIIV